MSANRREMDVTVGDVIRIGPYSITVVDIDGDEISFRILPADATAEDTVSPARELRTVPR